MDKDKIAKEFEDFVHIVSHDMAAPQRHIREFTKLLLASIDTPLNDEQKMYRGFIEKGLARVEKMQDALLSFSRVTTQAQEFEIFQSNDCIQSVVGKLTEHIKECQAKISVPDTSFSVLGDGAQIETVFAILINNALTYVADGVTPDISITADNVDGRVEFTVIDNGIGIHSDHSEQIFGMFRKLHAPDAYGGGSGAGLAIARKIIRRHGGDISVADMISGGSCFRFSVPIA
jgi:light-regulated signal transduction histidine kinase (bacteriophytochrome)